MGIPERLELRVSGGNFHTRLLNWGSLLFLVILDAVPQEREALRGLMIFCAGAGVPQCYSSTLICKQLRDYRP